MKQFAPSSGAVKASEQQPLQALAEQERPEQPAALLSLPLRQVQSGYLYLSSTVQLGCLDLPDCAQSQVHFFTEMGEDWALACGHQQGKSQTVIQEPGRAPVVNLAYEVVFRSTTPFGWPRLCVMVVGNDFLGRTVVQGYGVVHFPGQKGSQCRSVRLFRPEPKSVFTGLLGWLNGCRAEIKDFERVLAEAKGRQVMRVRGVGALSVSFESGLTNFGEQRYWG